MDSLENARALYTFEEDPGNVIRNHATTSAPDLLIPQTFRRFRPEWLGFPHPQKRSDIRDAIVNITGFIPFGFCLFLYLRVSGEFSQTGALWCAVLIGGLTSLAIELSQVFLPTRDSSALDLINNIIATLAGSMLGRVLTAHTSAVESAVAVHQHESFLESSRTLIEHRHSIASTIETVPEYSKETEKTFIDGASAS